MKRFVLFAVIGLAATLGLCAFDADPSGCDDKSTDQQIAAKQEAIQQRASDQVGLPNIVNYTELRRAKRIYELRDQARVATFSYTQDMNGHYHKVCDSIGYPLPYATQFSNPNHIVSFASGHAANILPQSEPNGLFMPSSAAGTWVECINPKNPNQIGVVYVEQDVTASPWPLE